MTLRTQAIAAHESELSLGCSTIRAVFREKELERQYNTLAKLTAPELVVRKLGAKVRANADGGARERMAAGRGGPDRRRALRLAAGVVWLAGLGACWIIPCRLALGPESSFYTFGYIGDEYMYAQRIQPLLPGTTVNNPFNGIADPQVISPFILENLCRAVLTCTGLDICVFAWAWRVAMPCVLAGMLALLARACLPRTRGRQECRPYSLRRQRRAALLYGVAAAAALPALCLGYDVLTPFPPLQGFIARFPTNIEYPLSVAICVLYVRFFQRRNRESGAALALAGAALVYLRPFAALPWGIAIAAGVLWLMARRQLRLRTGAVAAGVFLGALAPWCVIYVWNSRLPAYRETMARVLGSDSYAVHPQWLLYCLVGLALAAGGRWLHRRFRPWAWTMGLPLLVLPFVCGRLDIAREMKYDRLGVFYLVGLLALAMLALGRRSSVWRRRTGSLRAAWRLAWAGLAVALVLAVENTLADFHLYPLGPYPFVVADHRYLPAYEWVRKNTAPEALVAVDDGLEVERGPLPGCWLAIADLFALSAKRRVLYTNRMYGCPMPEGDLMALRAIHIGTFHGQVDEAEYRRALGRFRPDYVFWRKDTPIPRGYGTALRNESQVVYSDDVCEVWQLAPAGQTGDRVPRGR